MCRILLNVFVNLTFTAKHAICVKKAHLIYKKITTKAVQNVFVLVKPPDARALIFTELRYAL